MKGSAKDSQDSSIDCLRRNPCDLRISDGTLDSQLKAGVAWYGRLTGNRTELQPKYPVDVAGALKTPVLGLYGGDDPGIPLDTIDEMRKALKAAGSPSEIIVYPGAPHAFHADYRPSYRREPAEDGWKRLQAWFKKHGVA